MSLSLCETVSKIDGSVNNFMSNSPSTLDPVVRKDISLSFIY